MRIRTARLLPYRLPLKAAWQTAHGRFTERCGWLVRLEAESGLIGWGDCAPLPEAGTEAPDEAEAWLRAHLPRPADPLPDDAPPAARCALETALLDLRARANGLPLAEVLHPGAARSVEVAANAGALGPDTPHRLRRLAAAGYKVIKLKVGIAGIERELPLLRAAAEVLPVDARLRLDANQAWDEGQATAFLAGLRDLPIESLEEPLRRARPASLAHLQSEAPFPIALDESLASFGHDRFLGEKTVRRLVLKPMVLGGPLAALRLAERARDAGMECVVTTTVDSAVGTWAAAHLAAAVDGEAGHLAHGLATGEWLAADVGSPPMVVDGTIRLDEAPGLGMAPNID